MTTTTLQEIEVAAPRRKWPRYPEYKPSGTDWLANVPKHWAQQRLKWSLTALESGARETGGGNILDDGVFSIGGEHIGWNGDLYFDPPKFISDSYFASMQKGRVRRGDVLLVKDGATIGKLCHITDVPFGRAAVNEHVYILRSNYNTDSRFLFYFLQSMVGQQAIRLHVRGSAQPGLSGEFISQTEWCFPPLDEQRAIAAFLDRETASIDNLIARKQLLIELLAEEKATRISRVVTNGLNAQAAMTDSGVPWLGHVPAHWRIFRLKRVLAGADYGISDSLKESGEVAVLRMGNLQDGELSFADLRYVDSVVPELVLKDNDILFNRTNSLALIGKTALFHGLSETQVSFASYLVRFRTNGTMDPAYLCLLLNRPETLERARSLALPAIGQANLNPNRYGYIHVCVPPIPEQKAIVEHVRHESARIDRIASQVKNAITRLREYRSALIAAAVTGQIDVRHYGKEAT
jgi:type I restriction enzyme S subunit